MGRLGGWGSENVSETASSGLVNSASFLIS